MGNIIWWVSNLDLSRFLNDHMNIPNPSNLWSLYYVLEYNSTTTCSNGPILFRFPIHYNSQTFITSILTRSLQIYNM